MNQSLTQPIAVTSSACDWMRERLTEARGILADVPRHPETLVRRRYKRRNRIEIKFGRRKDRSRVATRYDRCPKVFLSAIALAATVMFWL